MKIALVELSNSHEECLFSQISFLKENKNEVFLFAHPSIKKQITYSNLFSEIYQVNFDRLKFFSSFIEQFKLVQRLSQFDKVIFNTASSSKPVRNILFFLCFYNVECIGIIHNIKKLQKSFTQKIISLKIKKYFVLSDLLKSNAAPSNAKIQLESFYPIVFPKFNSRELSKEKNEIWFTIPGRVEFDRRDYLFLINQLKRKAISKNIKFLILGNSNTPDGLVFKSEIKNNHLSSYFVLFDEFIDNELYYNYIKKSDFLMPLLKMEDSSYLEYKISGTFNIAFGFKKLLFCDSFYEKIPDLKENGFFYTSTNFIEQIHLISTKENTTTYVDKKWNYDFQYQKFINFIKN